MPAGMAADLHSICGSLIVNLPWPSIWIRLGDLGCVMAVCSAASSRHDSGAEKRNCFFSLKKSN
jgi:hypothetical protein